MKMRQVVGSCSHKEIDETPYSLGARDITRYSDRPPIHAVSQRLAHDENVGLLAKTLKTQGFKRQEGSGPKQVWRHADGQSVRWHPAPRNLDVGCTLRGPVLTVTWTRPTK